MTQKEIREDLSKFNNTLQNTSRVLMNQYVWRTGANLPGNSFRVYHDIEKPRLKGKSSGTVDLHYTSAELEHQGIPPKNKFEGVKNPGFSKTCQYPSMNDTAKQDSEQKASFWTVKKHPELQNKMFRGGQSQERDIFTTGKRASQQRIDLYKSKIVLS